MRQAAYLLIGFGLILAIIGVYLFSREGTKGRNTIKALGFEFQFAGSSLVIFLVGCGFVLFPFLYPDAFIIRSCNTDPDITFALTGYRDSIRESDFLIAEIALAEFREKITIALSEKGYPHRELQQMSTEALIVAGEKECLVPLEQ